MCRVVMGEGIQCDVRGEGVPCDVRGEGVPCDVRGEQGAAVSPYPQELQDIPLYHRVDDMCGTLHCDMPSMLALRWAVLWQGGAGGGAGGGA